MSTTDYVLPDNVEIAALRGNLDLSLTAGSTGAWINGNSGNNSLTGNVGDDRLGGEAGNDTLNGGAGDDVLEGGLGNDVFVIEPLDGSNVILDFTSGEDLIDITALGVSFEDLSIFAHATGSMLTYLRRRNRDQRCSSQPGFLPTTS